jgi:sugar diacid utilization regulator
MGADQADLEVPLDVLLSAYRVAAKVVWEEVVGTVAREHEMPQTTLIALAAQVIDYLDEISAAVGAAYLERRERLLRRRDQERDRVLHRLLAGDVSPELRRAAAACELDLTPPYRVIACVWPGDQDQLAELVLRPLRALTVSASEDTWMLLVDPRIDHLPACTAAIDTNPGVVFGVGPVADRLGDVGDAGHRAQRALDVGQRLVPERRIHDDAELGVFAVLDSDPEAMRRFVASVLGPLTAPGVDRHGELHETLEAVLSTSGLGEAAAKLGLHRHTVVYRLQRIRERGVPIDDPTRRHLLWLALRARRLLPA